MKEGETPAFLGLVANGLSYPDNPRADDWSSRYRLAGARFWDDLDGVQDKRRAFQGMETIAKWRPHVNADFQARMDWMKEDDVTKANHHAVAALNGRTHPNNAPVRIEVDVNQATSVRLSAAGSRDPDGDTLHHHWRQARLADNDTGGIIITDPAGASTEVRLEKRPGRTIHVVLTVKDNGTPSLYAHRRAVIVLK